MLLILQSILVFLYALAVYSLGALLLSRLIGLEGIWIGIVSGNLLSSVLGAVWAVATGRRLDSGIGEQVSAAQSRR